MAKKASKKVRRKVRPRRKVAVKKKTSPVVDPPAVPSLKPETSPVVRAPVLRRVRIRNRMAQLLTCSVIDDNGQVVSVRLAAHAVSEPYPEAHLTELTRGYAARGHVVLVEEKS